MSLSTQYLLTKYIKQYALDSHLNADLLRCLRVYQFQPQEQIYTAQTKLENMYFLVHGKVQVGYYLLDGKRSIVTFIQPFNIIGDIEIFKEDPLTMDVITTENSILLGLRKADVLQYGYDDPHFLRFLLHYMSSKLRGRGFTVLGNSLPLINRLALYLFNQPIDSNIITVENKSLIADFLGTSTRHLNRVIKTLEDEEIIRWQKNQVTVLAIDKLRSFGEI